MAGLNSDMMVANSGSRFIRNLAGELSLQLIEHGPTHRQPGSDDPKTWFDIMWVDSNNKIISFTNRIAPFHSDHNLIDVEIELF